MTALMLCRAKKARPRMRITEMITRSTLMAAREGLMMEGDGKTKRMLRKLLKALTLSTLLLCLLMALSIVLELILGYCTGRQQFQKCKGLFLILSIM